VVIILYFVADIFLVYIFIDDRQPLHGFAALYRFARLCDLSIYLSLFSGFIYSIALKMGKRRSQFSEGWGQRWWTYLKVGSVLRTTLSCKFLANCPINNNWVKLVDYYTHSFKYISICTRAIAFFIAIFPFWKYFLQFILQSIGDGYLDPYIKTKAHIVGNPAHVQSLFEPSYCVRYSIFKISIKILILRWVRGSVNLLEWQPKCIFRVYIINQCAAM